MTNPNEQAGLAVAVEDLLTDVAGDGFTLYCCGPRAAPNALVACYEWDQYVDLLTIQDFDRVTAARVPTARASATPPPRPRARRRC